MLYLDDSFSSTLIPPKKLEFGQCQQVNQLSLLPLMRPHSIQVIHTTLTSSSKTSFPMHPRYLIYRSQYALPFDCPFLPGSDKWPFQKRLVYHVIVVLRNRNQLSNITLLPSHQRHYAQSSSAFPLNTLSTKPWSPSHQFITCSIHGRIFNPSNLV